MNIEDMIAYDVLIKKLKAADATQQIHEILCDKKIPSTEYTKIATICPVLSGSLGVNIVFDKVIQTRTVWAAIYSDNVLISEAELTSSAIRLYISFPIEQPMTNYELRIRKVRTSDDATVKKIQLCGTVYETGRLFASAQTEG